MFTNQKKSEFPKNTLCISALIKQTQKLFIFCMPHLLSDKLTQDDIFSKTQQVTAVSKKLLGKQSRLSSDFCVSTFYRCVQPARNQPVVIDYSKQPTWELGVLMFEIAMGTTPFAGKSVTSLRNAL